MYLHVELFTYHFPLLLFKFQFNFQKDVANSIQTPSHELKVSQFSYEFAWILPTLQYTHQKLSYYMHTTGQILQNITVNV